jgi:hypothetical protein
MTPEEFNSYAIDYFNKICKIGYGFFVDFKFSDPIIYKETIIFAKIYWIINYNKEQWYEFLNSFAESFITQTLTHADYNENLRENVIFHYTRQTIIEAFEKWYNPIFPHHL